MQRGPFTVTTTDDGKDDWVRKTKLAASTYRTNRDVPTSANVPTATPTATYRPQDTDRRYNHPPRGGWLSQLDSTEGGEREVRKVGSMTVLAIVDSGRQKTSHVDDVIATEHKKASQNRRAFTRRSMKPFSFRPRLRAY
ncbi:hypothetical protein THAOC_22425 [Thalassiosira oceanica]|uniref:Uncharacterized protein n=1 Tax=Thalassiosira oceanica TaxID=159749 RepID=K0RX24_THAOC|nr:hypothetical protein THAOC_22425 [Thalassiosira oceanica]|eukprot:EJK57520.1 hypothetical protein THAOC_22425 [Thalassiosira oceanica]